MQVYISHSEFLLRITREKSTFWDINFRFYFIFLFFLLGAYKTSFYGNCEFGQHVFKKSYRLGKTGWVKDFWWTTTLRIIFTYKIYSEMVKPLKWYRKHRWHPCMPNTSHYVRGLLPRGFLAKLKHMNGSDHPSRLHTSRSCGGNARPSLSPPPHRPSERLPECWRSCPVDSSSADAPSSPAERRIPK